MNTYQSILEDIKNLGILKSDKIIIHSSMKKIGKTDGGADSVLNAFCDYIDDNGLIVLPCHTWGTIEDFNNIYNIDMPSNLGLLPNTFRKRKNVYRSLHPTHSVCAFGKGAKEFVKGEIGANSYCNKNSCIKKLFDMNGKVLLMGVTLTSNTFFHGIEEWMTDNHYWFNDKPDMYKVQLENGEIIKNPVYNTKIDTSIYFDKAMPQVLAEKSTKQGKIGDADCILIDMQKIYPIIENLIKTNPKIFMEE